MDIMRAYKSTYCVCVCVSAQICAHSEAVTEQPLEPPGFMTAVVGVLCKG